ncbi:bifunctional Transketolase C-terminal-Pyruvate-ferredoxin oxidoreductase domain II/Modulator of levamisole receptor-1/thiamine diphosphate-binding fold/Transketolase-like [Babesia duncani]|uniref:3-methyl-2-oxobutanoate dehydrogenase (2-methylpropanoyl-transferring) n=1 Tax=Babesia duncani TaxID=323732 RepID=A0AAD9PM02_9APIC|nr:bifunctional Transketolase C-terminal-Pyruvate-ferredoxin oxidoreductase domain II/Modulator of levamisole receptor-1/thiamine diphosphate-binding fold/Transketolase-like [Babesia duncani]
MGEPHFLLNVGTFAWLTSPDVDLTREPCWRDHGFGSYMRRLSHILPISKQQLRNCARALKPNELQFQAVCEMLTIQEQFMKKPHENPPIDWSRVVYTRALGSELVTLLQKEFNDACKDRSFKVHPPESFAILPARSIEAKSELLGRFELLERSCFNAVGSYWKANGSLDTNTSKTNRIAIQGLNKDTGSPGSEYIVNISETGNDEKVRVLSLDSLEKVYSQLGELGFAVVRRCFDPCFIKQLKKELHMNKSLARDAAFAMLDADGNVSTMKYTRGIELLIRIYLGRINCLIKGTRFEDALRSLQHVWAPIIHYCMGPNIFISNIQLVASDPGSYVEPWHRTNTHFGLTVVVALDRINSKTGRIQFLPISKRSNEIKLLKKQKTQTPTPKPREHEASKIPKITKSQSFIKLDKSNKSQSIGYTQDSYPDINVSVATCVHSSSLTATLLCDPDGILKESEQIALNNLLQKSPIKAYMGLSRNLLISSKNEIDSLESFATSLLKWALFTLIHSYSKWNRSSGGDASRDAIMVYIEELGQLIAIFKLPQGSHRSMVFKIDSGDVFHGIYNVLEQLESQASWNGHLGRCFSSLNEAKAPGAGETKEMNMCNAINDALHIAMAEDPTTCVFGQDVAFGGVFRCSVGLLDRFSEARCFNTPICEQGIVGFGIGMAALGHNAIAEIQFGDYIFPAFDQIVNEAAKFRYRSGSHWDVGKLTIRSTWGAVGHGGLYHSQSPEAQFAHAAGLKIVVPRGALQAKGLLLKAIRDPNPVLFFEPKALYRSAVDQVPVGDFELELSRADVVQQGSDVTIVGYGSAVKEMLKAAQAAQKQFGISVEVIDLQTVNPWDVETLDKSVEKTRRLIITHEAPQSVGMGAEIAATMAQRHFYHLEAPIMRVCGYDTPFPLAFEKFYLPDEFKLLDAIKRVCNV